MKIADLYGKGRPVFSFEFFPPKTDQAAEDLYEAVAELKERYRPDFISVTYGAGGSTRDRGVTVAKRIHSELNLNVLAHLTCTDHSAAELDHVVDELVAAGVENILALRGDAPAGGGDFVPHPEGFSHATELIQHLRSRPGIGKSLGLGAACYPENHPESPDRTEDMKWTLAKHEA
ncbi:MAG: methylenetetrahydrofolate reductase (NADPH) [Gammaproteobacteria bacterium]|jgi:methylenetetrahydrofolate reductase (NADPH)